MAKQRSHIIFTHTIEIFDNTATVCRAVTYLRRLVAGFSPRKPGSTPQASSRGIHGGQSVILTGSSSSHSVLSRQYDSTAAP
jgi:hypothetical protein